MPPGLPPMKGGLGPAKGIEPGARTPAPMGPPVPQGWNQRPGMVNGPNPELKAYFDALNASKPQYAPMDMSGYSAAFQGALNTARGNISQQLGTALADIQQSQQHAQNALGQLPGQVNAVYGQTQGTTNNALAQMAQAQRNSGMTPLMDTAAFMAPEQAAIAGSHAAQLANQPLLQQGIEQQVANRRAQAQLAAQERMGALDMQQAQFQQQLAMMEAENRMRFDAEQRAADRDYAGKLTDFALNKKMMDLEATEAAESDPLGDPVLGLGQKATDAIRRTPEYARLTQLIQSGADLNQVLAGTFGDRVRANPDLMNVIATDLGLEGGSNNFQSNVLQNKGPYKGKMPHFTGSGGFSALGFG